MKTSAAWLLERAGFGKGFGMPGPAALSTKHPLAVTNRGDARAADVLALARQVRDGVADAFGVSWSTSRCWSGCPCERQPTSWALNTVLGKVCPLSVTRDAGRV